MDKALTSSAYTSEGRERVKQYIKNEVENFLPLLIHEHRVTGIQRGGKRVQNVRANGRNIRAFAWRG